MQRKQVVQVLFFVALYAISTAALAGEAMPWDSGLKKFADALTGTTAMYVSLLAFAATAIMLIWGGEMGDFVKKLVMTICAGSLLVGASAAAKTLLGTNVTGALLGVM